MFYFLRKRFTPSAITVSNEEKVEKVEKDNDENETIVHSISSTDIQNSINLNDFNYISNGIGNSIDNGIDKIDNKSIDMETNIHYTLRDNKEDVFTRELKNKEWIIKCTQPKTLSEYMVQRALGWLFGEDVLQNLVYNHYATNSIL